MAASEPIPSLAQSFLSIQYKIFEPLKHIDKAALAHLGERQTEVHFMSSIQLHSGGTVFDPQKRHLFLFLPDIPSSVY
jgi:hypothetical protein